jgi:hypothetical protein
MPTHEKNYLTEDTTDLVTETPKVGLTGAVGGILAAAGDTPPTDRVIGEAEDIALVADVAAADSVTASAIDVTWTDPGTTKVDILVVVESTKAFVSRTEADADAETATIEGLTAGVAYRAYVRAVESGRVGPLGAGDPATVA